MIAGFGVDELDIDAHAIAAALDAAFEDIANVEFAPDSLHLERLALVGMVNKATVPGKYLRYEGVVGNSPAAMSRPCPGERSRPVSAARCARSPVRRMGLARGRGQLGGLRRVSSVAPTARRRGGGASHVGPDFAQAACTRNAASKPPCSTGSSRLLKKSLAIGIVMRFLRLARWRRRRMRGGDERSGSLFSYSISKDGSAMIIRCGRSEGW